MANLLDEASILLTPTAYDNGSMLAVKPTNGDGDMSFSRNSAATRVNAQGLVENVASNLPRIDYTGGCGSLLLEPQSTNLYLNSDTLVTQSNATNASSYTVSFYGTGTITFSGTHTGNLVGTGLNDRVSVTFTATSGTLISTISGSCTKGQLENLTYATSYIPTQGAISTRLRDIANNSGNASLINSEEGTLYAEIQAPNDNVGGSDKLITISDGTINNRVTIGFKNVTNRAIVQVYASGILQVSSTYIPITQGNNNKLAFKYKLNNFSAWLNGVNVYNDTSGITPSIGVLNTLSFNRGVTTNNFYGKTKAVAVFKTALTDAQLTLLTTI